MKQPPKKPRKPGRPRLNPDLRRDKIVEIRLNARERQMLAARAHKTRHSLATFMREASLRARIEAPPSVENIAAYAALHGAANNLNQAVKAVNSGLSAMDRQAIRNFIKVITELRRELVRRPR